MENDDPADALSAACENALSAMRNLQKENAELREELSKYRENCRCKAQNISSDVVENIDCSIEVLNDEDRDLFSDDDYNNNSPVPPVLTIEDTQPTQQCTAGAEMVNMDQRPPEDASAMHSPMDVPRSPRRPRPSFIDGVSTPTTSRASVSKQTLLTDVYRATRDNAGGSGNTVDGTTIATNIESPADHESSFEVFKRSRRQAQAQQSPPKPRSREYRQRVGSATEPTRRDGQSGKQQGAGGLCNQCEAYSVALRRNTTGMTCGHSKGKSVDEMAALWDFDTLSTPI